MKSLLKTCLLTLVLLTALMQRARSQSIRLLGADLANGALTGVALGGATMALQNSPDRGPLRVGLGLGILYGIGTGIYDNSRVSKGEQLYISGTFNDGKNSTVLVLLDTIYGAAGGAAIGSAISLIGNEPIIDGLQYGSGAGAWIGFGFGLIDSFALAQGPDQLRRSASINKNDAKGIVEFSPAANHLSLGLFYPSVIARKVVDSHSADIKYSMAMQVVNMKVRF